MKIRIAFTIPNFNTAGSGKALLNIALGLDKEIFDVHIVCQSDKGAFFKVVQESGLPVHVFDYIPQSRPLATLVTETIRVSRIWRKIKPDFVHSFHYSDNYTEALAVGLSGSKWLFTKKNMSWGKSSGRGWKLRSALAKAIAVQNTDMIAQFYPDSKKITLIPRGVNTKNFESQQPRSQIRDFMNTADDKRIIICVANMVPVKGVELLIEAFARLATSHPDWDLWLVGDVSNDYGKQLKEQVATQELQNRIHFSGKQVNVREYLDHAEIFVLPTKDEGRREGSPVALLEAMANGKVVIGSAVPGVKDQLAKFPQHQFRPGNVQSLTEILLPFLQNSKAENYQLGKSFSRHAQEAYSIEQEIDRHANLYQALSNGK